MSVEQAYIALGSNLGDRRENLRVALSFLAEIDDVQLLAISPIYENRAVGMGEASSFLNAVAKVEATLEPESLLEHCLLIEAKLGRERSSSWQPRTMDLDLLIFGQRVLDSEQLVLPHPRIVERDFVLKPLMDLAPQMMLKGKRLKDWYAALPEVELTPFADVISLSEI
ncbi:MAG: 2-amino-4-hydroxy-6-hydroxymethyldihydropteridine diphosphokinase [Verrucomicrobiota bacterium]